MLWLYIFMWVIGASLVVFAFALGVGARKFGLAVGMFIVGAGLVASALVAGHTHTASVHGVRPDAAPEMRTPGGT